MMTRKHRARVKRKLLEVVKLLDRKIEQMAAQLAAGPDPARRPLRPEQLN
jgi:hypothetical protein